MHVLARARRALARHPWLYWLVVLAAGGAVALVLAAAARGVDEARAAWGRTVPVVVATGSLAPGDLLAGAVEVRELPGPMVPPTALRTVPDDAVARQHVAPGEVVVTADVAPPDGPAALLPDAWAAVAVAEAVPSGVRAGDAVRAVAGGVELAGGLVVGHHGDAVLVAVPVRDAPAVAHAATTGELALVLVREP
jgi:hypothetical protein